MHTRTLHPLEEVISNPASLCRFGDVTRAECLSLPGARLDPARDRLSLTIGISISFK